MPHTGTLGGLALEIVIAVAGLVLAMLGVTGVWLWWRRRQVRLASAVRESADARARGLRPAEPNQGPTVS
jgi:uncharacterized iron-regulated membrane protein